MCLNKTSGAETRVALELLAHWKRAGGVELPDYNRNGAVHRLIAVKLVKLTGYALALNELAEQKG